MGPAEPGLERGTLMISAFRSGSIRPATAGITTCGNENFATKMANWFREAGSVLGSFFFLRKRSFRFDLFVNQPITRTASRARVILLHSLMSLEERNRFRIPFPFIAHTNTIFVAFF